ncbi:hypothetical protein I552_6847 [Mycobacterium xenopi 3993]|nr:hypothetical protein I552_6847 [Mycobacterium xenopi 3993]
MALLCDAIDNGAMPHSRTGLHPAIIESVEAIADAWPAVPDMLVYRRTARSQGMPRWRVAPASIPDASR